MLDRRWRHGVERGLNPLGEQLRRIGVSPDALTVFGLFASAVTAVLIATGHLGWAVVGVIVAGVSDLLDGAIARGSGQASPAVRSSTRSPTASPTRCCSAGAPGTSRAIVATCRSSPSRSPRARCSSPTSGPGPIARAQRAWRADGARRAVRVPRHRPRVRHPRAGAVGDARAHRVHRRRTASCGCTARPTTRRAHAARRSCPVTRCDARRRRPRRPAPLRTGGPPGARRRPPPAASDRTRAATRRCAAHPAGSPTVPPFGAG